MGLDFNHSEVGWSYRNFNVFRRKLAKEIGMDLDKMQGFATGGYNYQSGVFEEYVWGDISWDTVTDDIKDLLDHSDCDGDLSPEQCGVIAPRLIELVQDWSDDDWDKRKALELAEDMQWCSVNGETLEFI